MNTLGWVAFLAILLALKWALPESEELRNDHRRREWWERKIRDRRRR